MLSSLLSSCRGRRVLVVGLMLIGVHGHAVLAQAVQDLCDCAASPGLRPFDAADPSTYPAGTVGCAERCDGGRIVLPLPEDGVLRFSRFTADGAFSIAFAKNRANTPVTIRVAGDVTLRAPACCGAVDVSADAGQPAVAGQPGLGGDGGTGGFAGGFGHGQPTPVFTIGGAGGGPGGGVGATTTIEAIGGMFVGSETLQPIAGGSGGGGGSGSGFEAGCTGGGGGGGAGGLLLIANGGVTLENVELRANGGAGGDPADRACAQGGAGGSGGGIRLVARTFTGENGRVTTSGGAPGFRGLPGTSGRIRLESIDDTARAAFTTTPDASRVRIER